MAKNREHGVNERRAARRFRVAMRMEIWPEEQARQADAVFVSTRDVSLRGIYFFGEEVGAVGAKLNFIVLDMRDLGAKPVDLARGIGRVVRSEPLPSAEGQGFGVALAIEKTTHLHRESES